MRTRLYLTTILIELMVASTGLAQATEAVVAREQLFAHAFLLTPDDQDDPAYAAYKAGYNLILEEKWRDAIERLDRVISKYRTSKYIDDAQYWSAYALMHTNHKKAIEAYKKFLMTFPKSTYYDDAVADLARLQPKAPPRPVVMDTMHVDLNGVRVPDLPSLKGVGSLSRRWRGSFSGFGPRFLSPMSVMANDGGWSSTLNHLLKEGKLDQQTRLKVETLFALGEMKQDERTFQVLEDFAFDPRQSQELRFAAMGSLARFKWSEDGPQYTTLRRVSVDQKQPPDMRIYAMFCLSKFRKHDALPVFLEVVEKDTNSDVQQAAVEAIGLSTRDSERSVETLIHLYHSTAASNADRRRLILDILGDTKSDRAIGFLTEIASTYRGSGRHDDPEHGVWELSLDMLAHVTGNNNKTVEILEHIFNEMPAQRTQDLSGIMYRIANVGSSSAVDFFSKVARTHANYEIRSDAVYYLGNIGGERARTALLEILKER